MGPTRQRPIGCCAALLGTYPRPGSSARAVMSHRVQHTTQRECQIPGSSALLSCTLVLVRHPYAGANYTTSFSDNSKSRISTQLLETKRPPGPIQGDRILTCSGEHRQQVVCVKTTEQSFLSQAHLMRMLLPQLIERDVPHRRHVCRGMVLPNAAVVFVERDI